MYTLTSDSSNRSDSDNTHSIKRATLLGGEEGGGEVLGQSLQSQHQLHLRHNSQEHKCRAHLDIAY